MVTSGFLHFTFVQMSQLVDFALQVLTVLLQHNLGLMV